MVLYSWIFWWKNIAEFRRVCRGEYCLKFDDPLRRQIGSMKFDSSWSYVFCTYEEYSPGEDTLQIASWYIRLDTALTLSITFIYFDIQDVHDNCMSGNMTIEYSITRAGRELFPYCGFLPMFTHYKPYPFILLYLKYFPDIKVRVIFQFSVMSLRRISNRPTSQDDPTILFIHIINALRAIVVTFYLQVSKIQVISFRVSDWKSFSEYRIIDGPLLDGKLRKLNGPTFIGTSFQVVLQSHFVPEYQTYLGGFKLDDNQTGSVVRYGGIDTPSKKLEIKNGEKLEIIDVPGATCQVNTTRYCKLEFRAPHQHHINLTIPFMNFWGKRTSDCRYGGLAFFEERKHIMDTCEDYGTHRQSRNIYSINSSLTIVIHTYKYNNYFIQLKMRVLLTRCQPVRLHVFDLFEHCGFLGSRNSLDECKPILTRLNFSPEFQVKIAKNRLVYSLQLDTCVILLAANDFLPQSSFHSWNARERISFFGLHFQVITEPNRIIHYYDKLYFTLLEVIPDWRPKVPTASYIYLDEHSDTSSKFEEEKSVLLHGCVTFDKTLCFNFNHTENQTTPTLSKKSLYFYLYKGSIYEHEIHIFYSKQKVDNIHLISLDTNGVPLVGGSSSFNYYILVFMLKGDMDCSLPRNNTQSRTFIVTIDVKNRLDRRYFFSQTISDWAIKGILSCAEPSFYLATAGTTQVLKVTNSEMNDFNKHVNIFWWKGVRAINCELYLCENRALSHVRLDLQSSQGRKTIEAIAVNLTRVSLYFILRNYEFFNNPQAAQRAKYGNETRRLDEDETLFQSWNSASLICKGTGGYLPVFTSRKELEEFITFLKTGSLPMVEALYIGLTFNVSLYSILLLVPQTDNMGAGSEDGFGKKVPLRVFVFIQFSEKMTQNLLLYPFY